ncbi:hypothetical protein ACFL6D_03620 [Spirochaetota bacterium]
MLKKYFIVIFLLCSCGILSGNGSEAFSFSEISFGSAGTARGRTTVCERDSLEGIYYNPASLASQKRDIAILIAMNPYIYTLSLWNIGLSYKIPSFGTIALSGYGLSWGDILEENDLDQYVLRNYGINSAFAIPLDTLFDLKFVFDSGITVKYLREVITDTILQAFLFDMGGIISFDLQIKNLPTVFSLGLLAQNFGITLSNIKVDVPVASRLIPGIAYQVYFSSKKSSSAKMLFDLYYYTNNSIGLNMGGEIALFNLLFLRSGYILDKKSFSFGAGIAYPLKKLFFKLDYALSSLHQLGFQHNIQFGLEMNLSEKK